MKAIVLIGHGGIPNNFPSEKVGRLKMLEAGRQRANLPISDEEIKLDHEIRNWPRTPDNDPFCFGIRAIAERLEPKLSGTKLIIAYNEFCGPSIENAVADLVKNSYNDITLLTTMFTPGGVHSEFEIPVIVDNLKQLYPHVRIHYPWPFNLDAVAEFLMGHLQKIS